jgi:hypothetical protein
MKRTFRRSAAVLVRKNTTLWVRAKRLAERGDVDGVRVLRVDLSEPI